MNAPAPVRTFRVDCDSCPDIRRRHVFHSEDERNRFARRHSLATTHSITLTEETI